MSTLEIAELQQRVVALIAKEAEGEQALVVGNAIASATERFAVYRQGYVSRLVECLADDYPAVRTVLGEREFDDVATRYIARFPSTSFSLNGYGARLPSFLAETLGDDAVAELAQFEWAIVEVIHAPNPPAQTSREGSLSPAGVSLELGSALRIFATRFRLAEYCRTVLEQRQALDGAERPARADVYALVVRRDYRVFKLDLEPEPGRVLEKLLHGSALDVALDGVRAAPEVVQGWFAEWVRLGAVRLA